MAMTVAMTTINAMAIAHGRGHGYCKVHRHWRMSSMLQVTAPNVMVCLCVRRTRLSVVVGPGVIVVGAGVWIRAYHMKPERSNPTSNDDVDTGMMHEWVRS